MVWQLNPYAIPFVLAVVPLGYCIQLVWRRRAGLPERLFLAFAATLLWLVLLYAARLLATDAGLILWLAKLEYPANQMVAVIWLLFNLAYVGYERWINRRLFGLLAIFPLVYMALVWTNEFHYLHWTQVGVREVHSLVIFDFTNSYSLAFWSAVAYTYLLLLAATIVIVHRLVRSPAIFRQQARILLMASLLPWAATVVEVAQINPLPMLDIGFFSMIIAVGMLAWSLFRYRLLDLAPAAHDMIVRSISDAIFVLDSQGRIVEANPAAAKLTGSGLNDLVGQPATDIFTGISEQFAHLCQEREVTEELTDSSTNELRTLDVRISPLLNPWGAERGRTIIVRDITEHRRAEQQAAELALEQEKVKLLHEFIDITSHDLNTPLTTLRISTDLLRIYTGRLPGLVNASGRGTLAANGTNAGDDLEKLVQSIVANGNRIHESTIRLHRLVNEMLEMVRLDKQLKLEPVAVGLNEVLRHTLTECDPAATEKGVTLVFEPDPTLGAVALDSVQFNIALQHVTYNAITYTPAGGTITLHTQQNDAQALVEIRDTGIGIAADDLPHIFDRFYRADKARNTQTGGMGLGLAIAKRIVEAHRGRIEVESTPGLGATFRIFLPIAAELAPASSAHTQMMGIVNSRQHA
jgi:PAS domain S-box-containing protein